MLNKSTGNHFAFLMFFFGFILFSANNVLAAPSVTSISGSMNHGQDVTIYGSGFGTKSPATPLFWKNHEACSVDSDIVGGCGYENLGTINSTSAFVKNDRHYGNFGSKSARMDYATGWDSMFPRIGHLIRGGALEIYLSTQTYWTRYAGSGGAPFIFKWARAGSLPTYSGKPQFQDTIRPDSSGHVAFWYNVAYSTDQGVYGNGEGTEGQDSGKWNRVEYYYKLSNPAGSNTGAVVQWVNSVKNVNFTNVVTRTSNESSSLIDWVISPFDGNDQYGLSNGYYLWLDDYYLDITQARVEICSGSTWVNRGKCEIQPPTVWDANGQKIIITVNQGGIPSNTKGYLYVVDSNGLSNSNGYAIIFGGTSSPSPIPNPPTNLVFH